MPCGLTADTGPRLTRTATQQPPPTSMISPSRSSSRTSEGSTLDLSPADNFFKAGRSECSGRRYHHPQPMRESAGSWLWRERTECGLSAALIGVPSPLGGDGIEGLSACSVG